MKFGKKLFCFLLTASCLCSSTFAASISVTLDTHKLQLSKAPTMINNSVYLPLRTFSEALGYEVKYDATSQSVTVAKNGGSIVIGVHESANGTSALLQGDTTYVPLRLVSESFGYDVDWDGKSKTVNLTTLEPADFDAISAEAAKLIVDGDYEAFTKLFDSGLSNTLNVDTLKSGFDRFEADYGKIVSHELVSIDKGVPYAQAVFKINYPYTAMKLTLVFNLKGQIAGIETDSYPVEVNLPEGAIEKNLTVGQNGATLTLPGTSKDYPVVILVHASGPNDRDETVYNTKIFRDIAYGLAEQGIATLRYDKITYTDEMLATSKTLTLDQEVTDDVLRAIDLMKNAEHIDSNNIFLFGHSLGGMLMPYLSEKSDAVKGYIMAGAPATTFAENIFNQYAYMAQMDETMSEDSKVSAMQQVAYFANAVSELDFDKESEEIGFGGFNNLFWCALNNYDHIETAQKMTKPLFIIQGERDFQTTMNDFKLWQDALKDHDNVTLKSYPALNHLLVEGKNQSTPDEYYLHSQVSPNLIKDIGKWIASK